MNRRLYRSVVDRRIGGVAAGSATYFDIDPSIARVLWLLLAFFSGGVFFVVYLVMWAVVPEEPYPTGAAAAPGSAPASGAAGDEAPAAAARGPGGRVILGAILIVIGAWFLAAEFLPWLNWDLVWPVGLVVIGILVLATALRRSS
ncbi:MAG TPA: PspC domain-containing protein [Pleomorphomonadaceae bacterium]|nr:PspC domain-containing protein [Pleomorphomonadaceae bacterium]